MKYVSKDIYGIKIVGEKEVIENQSMLMFLDKLCLDNGSTYKGRIASAKHLLRTKGLVPLFVKNDLILIPTKNIREHDIFYINYYKILKVVKQSEKMVKVVFDDLDELILNVSFSKFNRQYQYAQTLLNRFTLF